MGSQQSTTVSVIADGEQESPFAPRRHPDCQKQIFENPPDVQTMQQFALKYFHLYGPRLYLGARPYLGNQQYGPQYQWKTYEEGFQIAKQFGRGLYHLGIQKGSIFGIYAENSYNWVHSIDASSLYGFAIASLYDSLGNDSIIYIMRHSKMESVLVSDKNTKKLVDLIAADFETSNPEPLAVKSLILYSEESVQYATENLSQYNISIFTFDRVCEIGRPDDVQFPSIDPEDIHLICYSSGTTGLPKGVIISHRAQISTAFGATHEIPLGDHARHLSYLPLAHIFERSAISISMMAGGQIGFISGGVSNLTADMAALKPTFFAAVPRVMNRFYDALLSQLKKEPAVLRMIFWGAWYARRFCIRSGIPSGFFKVIFGSLPKKMGGCVEQVIVGGAALDPNIQEILQVAMGLPVRTGYGLTEAGSGNIISPLDIKYIKPGTVGGPLINAEIKLDPIQDYNDDECGEIIIKGQCIASGYLHDPATSAELFTDETHTAIRTGDVGKWDKDGYMCVVDRLRSIFKLSQGEYVAAELVTQVFEEAPLVNQIFVYGDSSRTCLVAIVVPDKKETASFLGKHDKISDLELAKTCQSPEFKKAILDQLTEVAKKHKLFGYQFVKAVHCDPIEWTIDNELLTPTFKLKRKKLGQKYEKEIQQLYKSLETK